MHTCVCMEREKERERIENQKGEWKVSCLHCKSILKESCKVSTLPEKDLGL